MKAPDKIIIVQYEDGELSEHWCKENRTNNISVEYIRKDALIEWADSERTDCINAFFFDEADLYNNLIDKLNSL